MLCAGEATEVADLGDQGQGDQALDPFKGRQCLRGLAVAKARGAPPRLVGQAAGEDSGPLEVGRVRVAAACTEWCPNNAIHHGYRNEKNKYRHSRMNLDDMFEQANRQAGCS